MLNYQRVKKIDTHPHCDNQHGCEKILFTEDQVPVVNEVATHTAEVSNVIGSFRQFEEECYSLQVGLSPLLTIDIS
jgi:hypothetical protein